MHQILKNYVMHIKLYKLNHHHNRNNLDLLENAYKH